MHSPGTDSVKPCGAEELTCAQLIEAVSDPLSIHDLDLRVVRANRAMCELLGLPEDRIVGRRCHELFHEGGDERPDCPHLVAKGEGRTTTCELVLPGRGIPLAVTASPLCDAAGGIVGTVHIARDISATRAAEAKLRQSEQLFHHLMDHLTDFIIVIDPTGAEGPCILDANEHAAVAHGYTMREFIGLPLSRLDVESDAAGVPERVRRILAGERITFEVEHRRKDGSVFPVEVTAQLLPGDAPMIFTLERDITERRAAARELRASMARAEELHRRMQLFTDILSHDLLTPAGIAAQAAELLLGGGEQDRRAGAELVLRNTRRIREIVQDASTYAQVTHARVLEKTPRDLAGVVSEALLDIAPRLEARGMKVRFLDAGSAVVPAHPLLSQVFANLLSNTLKYAPEGSTVTVEVAPAVGGWVVSVADEGDGVPDEHKKSIFVRFQRRHREGVKGTGLGLAIARQIVQLHGGRIWVEDAHPRGSVFRVFLPAGGGEGVPRA